MASSKNSNQVGLAPSVAAPSVAGPSVAAPSVAALSGATPLPQSSTSKQNERKRKLSDLAAEKSNDVDVPNNEAQHLSTENDKDKNSASPILIKASFDPTDFMNSEYDTLRYTLTPILVDGVILCDSAMKRWRLGKPVGKGGCGEVFLASDITTTAVTSSNAVYVAKLEPHTSGYLFQEMHCLMNAAKTLKCCRVSEHCIENDGIPKIHGHGSHQMNGKRYRFIILERYHECLGPLVKLKKVAQKSILIIAVHILNALENLHKYGYCHNDVKANNIMIMKYKNGINPESASKAFQPNSVQQSVRIQNMVTRRMTRRSNKQRPVPAPSGLSAQIYARPKVVDRESLFLIDYGLALKFQNNRPHFTEQYHGFAGTLSFASRDAHMGTYRPRSDLECLGYNLLLWSEGYLPWSYAVADYEFEKVHQLKEFIMIDARNMMNYIYGNQVPKFLGEFLHLVSQMNFQEQPDYERCRDIFKREYKQLGYDCEDMQLNSIEIQDTSTNISSVQYIIRHDIIMLRDAVLNGSVPVNPTLRSLFLLDPDQIASKRVAKEATNPLKLYKPRQYEGKPNYAIMKIKQRLRSKGKHVNNDGESAQGEHRAAEECELNEASTSSKSRKTRPYEGNPTYAILEVIQRLRSKGKPINIVDDESHGDNNANHGPDE